VYNPFAFSTSTLGTTQGHLSSLNKPPKTMAVKEVTPMMTVVTVVLVEMTIMMRRVFLEPPAMKMKLKKKEMVKIQLEIRTSRVETSSWRQRGRP
jgi:hypothetical protein